MKHCKIRLLLTVALMASFSVNAQQKTPKFFAEISAGPSFPIGQFGEKEYPGIDAKDQPGMAKTGIGANIAVGYYIKENAGFLLTGGYSTHVQKPAALEEYIKRNFYVNATEVDIKADDWMLYKIMGGVFWSTPLIENKLDLVTKASAGILKTAVPKYSWLAYTATGPAFAGGENEEVKLPTAFCYQISVGLQYKATNRLYYLFDINSFNASATDKAPSQPIGNPPGMPAVPDKKYKFGSLNALIGVGVSF